MADTVDSMNKEMSFTVDYSNGTQYHASQAIFSRVNIIKKKVYLLDVAINVHIV